MTPWRFLALGLGLLLLGALGTGTRSAPLAQTGSYSSSTDAVATVVAVDIRGFAFVPATVNVVKGTTVTWTNRDDATHTVTAVQPPGAFDSGPLATGATFSFTFNTAGNFNYHCSIHPFMTGAVIVSDTPTPTPTPTLTSTPTRTPTLTPTSTTTPGATATQTTTPASTSTPVDTPTETTTPASTSTPVDTPTETTTSASTSTPMETPTPILAAASPTPARAPLPATGGMDDGIPLVVLVAGGIALVVVGLSLRQLRPGPQ